jgi:hypothetical protein
MRTLVLLLLLANVTLLGFTVLDRAGHGEGIRLKEQVAPDKIKLLTPQQVAALGPAKVAALADVCLEWGPFSDAERSRALAEIDPLGLGRLLTQKRVESASSYWVFLPPAVNKAAADKRLAELKAAGVKDVFVVDNGPQRFAISLGVFRTEEAANVHAAQLAAQQGVTNAKVGPRQQSVVQTLLIVRDPQAPAVARIKELQPGFPGTEVKIGSCEKTG